MWPLPSDESRHPPGPEPGWEESWAFDFVAGDGGLGGAVRLGLRSGRAWYWSHLAGRTQDLVAVRDHDLDLPRGRALEVRGSGLWAELTCETPLDHWSAGLEAVGVAFDHPGEAYGDERGQPVAVGLDLEWEAAGPCLTIPGSVAVGYEQPCDVHGEVLVGVQRIDVDASGWRTHEWGVFDWWGGPGSEGPGQGQWWRAHGRLDDGTTLLARGTSDADGLGVVVPPGGLDSATVLARLETSGDPDLPGAGALTIGDTTLDVAVMVQAPVLVPGPRRSTAHLWRAMCRFVAPDGRHGTGWCQRLVVIR